MRSGRRIKGIVFDWYGTLADLTAVKRACTLVAADPATFFAHWRAKQLDSSLLRSLMGNYRDFWQVTEEALADTIRSCDLRVTLDQRRRLMETWLYPTLYPDALAALPQLHARYPMAILSNGTPKMLRAGLDRTGIRRYFRWVLSADAVRCYKPSPRVYRLAPTRMRLNKRNILFVSSNAFDVNGATHFGFTVCWVNGTGEPQDSLGPKPEFIVATLEELVARLEGSVSSPPLRTQ